MTAAWLPWRWLLVGHLSRLEGWRGNTNNNQYFDRHIDQYFSFLDVTVLWCFLLQLMFLRLFIRIYFQPVLLKIRTLTHLFVLSSETFLWRQNTNRSSVFQQRKSSCRQKRLQKLLIQILGRLLQNEGLTFSVTSSQCHRLSASVSDVWRVFKSVNFYLLQQKLQRGFKPEWVVYFTRRASISFIKGAFWSFIEEIQTQNFNIHNTVNNKVKSDNTNSCSQRKISYQNTVWG